MKKLVLFLLGLIPFVLGFLMHSWMMENMDSVLPYKLIGFVFLGFWIVLGFLTSDFAESQIRSAMIINLPAFLVVLFIVFQEIILGYYWTNLFGLAMQLFYLPLINISGSLIGMFLRYTPWSITGWLSCIVGFLFMFGSYYLGSCFIKRHESYSYRR